MLSDCCHRVNKIQQIVHRLQGREDVRNGATPAFTCRSTPGRLASRLDIGATDVSGHSLFSARTMSHSSIAGPITSASRSVADSARRSLGHALGADAGLCALHEP